MTLEGTLLQTCSAAAAAAISATVATQLALRTFYKQQRWQAKRQAYDDIVIALHNVRRHLVISLEAIDQADQQEDSFFDDAFKKQRDAWEKIALGMDLGEYLICSEATKLLDELASNWDSLGTYKTFMEIPALKARIEFVTAALARFKREAGFDLGTMTRPVIWEASV